MANVPNIKRLERLLREEGFDGPIFYDEHMNETNPEDADEWQVVLWEDGYNNFSGKLPKQKPFTFEYVMGRVAKQRDLEYRNYSDLFAGLDIVKEISPAYGTSMGISVATIFTTDLDEKFDKIREFLDDNEIVFTEEFSESRWVKRFKISYAEENIERVRKLTQ